MLLLIIIHLVNKFTLDKVKRRIGVVLTKAKYIAPIFLLSFSSVSNDEDFERLNFSIFDRHSKIGTIVIERSRHFDSTFYSVKSSVNTSFIFKYEALGKEEYIFKNDTLIYSKLYRRVNKKVKADQTLLFKDGQYHSINSKRQKLLLTNPVTHNIVMLFFHEPVGIDKIFSDKFKIMVCIQKLNEQKYKLKLPNGSYSIFYYTNGKCSSIESVGSFYKIKIIPKT